MFEGHKGKKIVISGNAAAGVRQICRQARTGSVAVLSSGDPNFYGIASLLYEKYPKKYIEIIPNITAYQAAFARIREPWEAAHFTSIHGRDISCLHETVCKPGLHVIYCDGFNTPAAAAAYIIGRDAALSTCSAWVFDSLGTAREKTFAGRLKKMLRVKTSPLAMMIFKNDIRRPAPGPGIPDSSFAHERSMITRRDIRLLAVSRLELSGSMVLWDIGAGSGSVAIEASCACPGIRAFAIEKNSRRLMQLKKNIRKFQAANVSWIGGSAPDAFLGLPRPDRVFIGGTGGALEAILNNIKKLLPGDAVIVINCVTMATLEAAMKWFRKARWPYEITSVTTATLSSGSNPEIFRSDNPIFIFQGRAKPGLRCAGPVR